ncbi:MAG: hypothetical protein ACE5EG_07345 [Thermoanaerobaculia bacterium]
MLGAALLSAALAGCGEAERDAAPGGPLPPQSAAVLRQIDPPAGPGALAPNLALTAGGPLLSWLEPTAEGHHRLLTARFDGRDWEAPVVVTEGEGFFANWADLPAAAESGDGSLVAHWLAKTAADAYAYSIFLARSVDGGGTWTELGRLNDDDTPTEHGFVSYAAEADGLRAFWLDGREMGSGGPMGLRTALISETVGASELLDERVCECCSTDATPGPHGSLVVYRDRGDGEVRDISVVRGSADAWSAPAPTVADGWRIAGCPVNGPAVDAAGQVAAVAWFTAAGEAPRVQAAFSADGGATFGPVVLIDADSPHGRVDLVLDGGDGAIVSWLAAAGEAATVSLRRVRTDGAQGEALEVATTGAARASGFPRLVRRGEALYLAWVDTLPAEGQRIRARMVPVGGVPSPT